MRRILPRGAFDPSNVQPALNGDNCGNPLTSAWGQLLEHSMPEVHALHKQTYLPGPYPFLGMAAPFGAPSSGDPTLLPSNPLGYRGDLPRSLQPKVDLPPPWMRVRG